MSNRSLFAREMGKNDMLGVIIIAIVTIVVGIYNIWLSFDKLSYLNSDEFQEELTAAEEILELDDPDAYFSPDIVELCEDIVGISRYAKTLDTIDIVLYAGIVIMGVLMLMRFRPSFLISTILYVLATITYIIYAVYSLIHGGLDYATESLEGSIFVVILRIGVIKMLVGMAIAAHSSGSMPAQPVYTAPAGGMPPVPTERVNSSIDPVTGQTVASSMPEMLQKQPVQNAAQSVHGASMMESVAPVSHASAVPQPVARPYETAQQPDNSTQEADWQCRGCGFMNTAKNDTCAFCGTKKS